MGTRPDSRFLSHKEKEKYIEDYLEIKTATATKRAEDVETAIEQEQDHMRNAEQAGWTTTKSKSTFEETLNAIRDSLSDLASSNGAED